MFACIKRMNVDNPNVVATLYVLLFAAQNRPVVAHLKGGCVEI